MDSVKNRMIAFLDYLNISQRKFEKATGLSNGAINNIGESITTKTLNKITAIYPDLNTAWLLTGVGEMLNNKDISSMKKDLSYPKELTAADRAMILTNRDWLIRVVSEVFQMPIDKAKALLDQDTISKHDEILKQA